MGAEHAIDFYKAIIEDTELQKKISDTGGDRGKMAKFAVELGKERGLDFTPAEFLATHTIAQNMTSEGRYELDEAQLEAVSGGGSWFCTGHTGCGTCGHSTIVELKPQDFAQKFTRIVDPTFINEFKPMIDQMASTYVNSPKYDQFMIR